MQLLEIRILCSRLLFALNVAILRTFSLCSKALDHFGENQFVDRVQKRPIDEKDVILWQNNGLIRLCEMVIACGTGNKDALVIIHLRINIHYQSVISSCFSHIVRVWIILDGDNEFE